jgi:WS/DGAT/MGAT family acyltransferase
MLRVDNPTSVTMVTGLMIFGAPIPRERMEAIIKDRILRFDRFRQRLVVPRQSWRRPYWQDAPSLDFAYHLKEVTLPPPADQAALQELLGKLAITPLDRSRPLWQMHLVGPCNHGCALICRVHHSLADGVALAHVVLSMTDCASPDGAPEQEQAEAEREALTPERIVGRRRGARRLVQRGLSRLMDLPEASELAQFAADAAADVGDIVFSPDDTPTVLRGAPSVPKRVVWSDAIPLDDIKAVGRRMGATVNDILLTATAGALRDYLLARGESLDSATLRALVPVSLRPPGRETELGNRIGVLFLPLPVELADPAERLAELKWRMDGHKGSLQAPILGAAMRAGGRLPTLPLNLAVDYLCTKASVVVTNVKGPTERRTVAGSPMEAIMFWIPRYGGIGVAVTILSYAGQVRVGVISDRDTVADPETIVADFQDEVKALLAQVTEPPQAPPAPSLASRLDDTLGVLDRLLGSGAG